ncbi:hypothetical protein MRX96_000608 [Rhipicephalus microplus]
MHKGFVTSSPKHACHVCVLGACKTRRHARTLSFRQQQKRNNNLQRSAFLVVIVIITQHEYAPGFARGDGDQWESADRTT